MKADWNLKDIKKMLKKYGFKNVVDMSKKD